MKPTFIKESINAALMCGLIALMLISGEGCRRSGMAEKRFWKPTGNELADRINDTLDMNHYWVDYTYLDKLMYARRLDSIGRCDNNRQVMARAAYWEGTVIENMIDENEEVEGDMGECYRRAAVLCDSTNYPYDWARIASNNFGDSVSAVTFREEVKVAAYMKNVGDTLRWAGALAPVIYDLKQIGDTVNARKIEKVQERLFMKLGYSYGVWQCRYSQFMDDYFLKYRDKEISRRGEALADSLLSDPSFQSAGWVRAYVYLYKYRVTKNIEWLDLAEKEADYRSDGGGSRSVVAGEKARRLLSEGKMDEARKYIGIFRELLQNDPVEREGVSEDIDYNYFSGEKEDLYDISIDIYKLLGKQDSVDIFTKWKSSYFYMRDNINKTSGLQGVLVSADNSLLDSLMDVNEDKDDSGSSPGKGMIAGIISILLLLGGAGVFLTVRFRREGKREMCDEAEPDESESETHARKLAGNIRAEIDFDRQWEDAEALFARRAPHYRQRLKERYPDISSGDLRMACLVVIGLDNKQIARLLNINPESAKKNRQRLRRRLDIAIGVDMERFLLRYLD